MSEMENESYWMDDFTEDNYRKLLGLAKQHYTFVSPDGTDDHDTFIVWRHDIDCSPHRSLSLAKIEDEEEIHSTYFVLLNAHFYNVFEPEIKNILREILLLGHHLGLHFDGSTYRVTDPEELERWLHFEKNILEVLLDTEIRAFSYHDPTPDVLRYDDLKYAGMVNTYSRFFRKCVGYCSDSNGYWIHERLEDVLTEMEIPEASNLDPSGMVAKSTDESSKTDREMY